MKNILRITGTVFSGLGKGSFFVGLEGYNQQFENKLGIKPFRGTLNLRVNPDEARYFLLHILPIKLTGFFVNDREFGELVCHQVKINDILSYIVIPAKSRYKEDVFEIISEENLREKLGLKDGDEVIVRAE